jgi:very-short-patch-repair endonuclease
MPAKLKSQYRSDKKSVANVTRSRKATREAIDGLSDALEWQGLSTRLRQVEEREAQVLGSYYYRSRDTDFGVLTQAIEVARRSSELLGGAVSTEALRRHLGRGGNHDSSLVSVATRLQATVAALKAHTTEVVGGAAARLFDLDLTAFQALLAKFAVPVRAVAEVGSLAASLADRPISIDELQTVLVARSVVEQIETAILKNEGFDRAELGESYEGLNTRWEVLESALEWAEKLRGLLSGPVSPAAAQRLASLEVDWQHFEMLLSGWERAVGVVVSNFVHGRAVEVRSDLASTFDDAAELLHHLGSTVADIDEWVDFTRSLQALAQVGVKDVIDFCVDARLPSSQVRDVVERACLESWADAVIDGDMSRLRHLRAEQLDPTVDEFRALDRELVQTSAAKVISACNARRPRTTIGAAGIIKREAEKQRRHMPVRVLLEQAGEVAQLLKPCFMMSPLTVSQFLPSSLSFDVVVFDEASQVRPSDAVNCIYRGRQLIIAGDDKQLPPTSFFEAVSMDGGDEWEEDQFEEFESIIKLGKGSGGLRELPLRWHYRSQHEDLITYSNFSFYDGRLVTFPGGVAEADDLGVALFSVVDGVYRRGTARDNPKEAEVVVDRIVHWARMSLDNPTRAVTLGVVAFSEAQAGAIEVALDRRRRGLPELDAFFDEDRLDGFFVKNLESVQGDERDVMIFSVGYGRDENGKLTMNFGPLNREGGERRLNVAITRARRRIELVASITGAEPEFATALRDGPRHLQRYLDYAARGPVALAIDLGSEARDAESPFEEEVIRTINAWGYKVQPQVGTAGYRVDIGVWHPTLSGRFALGVECDGRMYHSSKVARDRDRIRQDVLMGLGWRLHRIWGTSWYRHRPEQEVLLKAAIEDAIAHPSAKRPEMASEVPATKVRTEERFDPVPLDEQPPWTVAYRVAALAPHGYLPEIHLPEAQPFLRQLILAAVQQEGPIEDELLLRRVREAWGVGRAGHRIRDNFVEARDGIVRRGSAERLEKTFTFVGEEQLRVVRVPSADERSVRTVGQVSRTEQMLAIKHLVEDARRVSRDELTYEVCRLFGWNRRGPDIGYALDEALNALIRGGAVVNDTGFLRLS